jgi:DNA replication regulator SLD3
LSTTLLDKKYRDGVPAYVSLIDIQDHNTDDADQPTTKSKKRKGGRKMKPGKTGLYPMEDGLIRRWWSNHDDDSDSSVPGGSREELAKCRVSQLRIRETQLQMIVILEILALQPLTAVTEDITGDLPAAIPSTELDSKDATAKIKKPNHLSKLIDVHIDRLCIWQSVAFEFIKAPLGDSQKASEPPHSSTNQSKHADNILRDFCVEVIAPL